MQREAWRKYRVMDGGCGVFIVEIDMDMFVDSGEKYDRND